MKISVISPRVATGGPEALHQLVDSCVRAGFDCSLHYYDRGTQLMPEFASYDAVHVSPFATDSDSSIVVLPEAYTSVIPMIRKARIVFWWLSVDNNLGKFQDFGNDRIVHAYQSEYARLYLESKGVSSAFPLFDYIHESYSEIPDTSDKLRMVVFNPSKGIEFAKCFIEALGTELAFAPIVDLTRKEVRRLLAQARVYFDFGSHPGKDRIPREAALLGNCIVVGKRGSAINEVDVPIDPEFKVDLFQDPDTGKMKFNLKGTLALIKDLVMNHANQIERFDAYRAQIRQQKSEFDRQVRQLFQQLQR